MAIILLIPLFFFIFREDVWQILERTGYAPLLWVVILSVTLRLVILPILSTNFLSDFEDIHNFAVDVASGTPFSNLDNYPSIPSATHLNMTGLVMSVFYRIFGGSFTTAKAVMIILSTLTLLLVYLTGKELDCQRTGLLAASIYGTLPSLICYTGVLTGEHFALLFIMLAIFFTHA